MKIRWHKHQYYKRTLFGRSRLYRTELMIEYYNEATSQWDCLPCKETKYVD